MIGRFSLTQLKAMPTILKGHDADLKFEHQGIRVWLSRLGVKDGVKYPNMVEVEQYIDGKWEVVKTYRATYLTDYPPDHPFVKDLQIS